MDPSDAAKIGLLAGVVGTFLVAVLQMDGGRSDSAKASSTRTEIVSG